MLYKCSEPVGRMVTKHFILKESGHNEFCYIRAVHKGVCSGSVLTHNIRLA